MRIEAKVDDTARFMQVFMGKNFDGNGLSVKWVDDQTKQYCVYREVRVLDTLCRIEEVRTASRLKINLAAGCIFILE